MSSMDLSRRKASDGMIGRTRHPNAKIWRWSTKLGNARGDRAAAEVELKNRDQGLGNRD